MREVDRAAPLRSLVIAMLTVGAEKPLGRLIKHAWSCGKFDLTDAHLAAVFGLERQLAKLATPRAAISKWLSCRSPQWKAAWLRRRKSRWTIVVPQTFPGVQTARPWRNSWPIQKSHRPNCQWPRPGGSTCIA